MRVGTAAQKAPEIAEREIVTAAESLLRERPFRELTVDEVMRRTTSRACRSTCTSAIGTSSCCAWSSASDRSCRRCPSAGCSARATAAHRARGARRHRRRVRRAGPVMRALADAATNDLEVEQAYGALVQTFIDATAPHIDKKENRAPDPPARRRRDRKGTISMMKTLPDTQPRPRAADHERGGRGHARHDAESPACSTGHAATPRKTTNTQRG